MKMLDDFKKFAMRGNLVELAIGFTVGASFSTVAKSLVTDIIMPPIGLLVGGVDFADLYVILRKGSEAAAPYATLQQAQAAGAVTLNYGVFLNNVFALLLIAVAMFLIIRAINRVDELLEKEVDTKAEQAPNNKKCPYCRETIAYRATRCPHCTSELEQAPVHPEARE